MNNHIYYCVLLRDKSTSETEHKLFFADAIENQTIRRSMGYTM